MSKKILATGTVALFLLTVLPSTYAFGGFGQSGGNKNFDPESREAVEAAIEAENYSAFVEATGNANLTEERFETVVERHAERETRRAENEADREEIQAAVEAGNYEAWASLIAAKNPDAPILAEITADNFSQVQEIHELRNQMRGLQEGLGIGGGSAKGFGGTYFGGKKGGQRGQN